MSSYRFTATFAALIMISSAVSTITAVTTDTRAAESSDSMDIISRISGERINETIDKLATFDTRAFYTSSCWNASTLIHDEFADLGLWVYYQELTVSGFLVRNVVAVKNGTIPDAPQYLFGAHYDCANRDATNYSDGGNFSAPGADDDASGVAGVLELARVLDGTTSENTLKFAAFTAEESGLNGSRYFAEQEFEEGTQYADTVLMDMIGYTSDMQNRMMLFPGTSSPLSLSIESAVEDYDLDLTIELVTGYGMRTSDHLSFWQLGYPSMLVIEHLENRVPVYPYYHTANDTLEHLSTNQMVVITKAVLGGFLTLENPIETSEPSHVLIWVGIAASVTVALIIIVYAVKRRRAGLER